MAYVPRPGGLDEHVQAAALAAQAGNWRGATDAYKNGYVSSGDPTSTWPLRYNALRGYCSTLTGEQTRATSGDLNFLRGVGTNENEPVVNRSRALFCLGFVKWLAGDRESAARNYRRALEVLDSPEAASQRAGTFIMPSLSDGRCLPHPLAPELDNIREAAATNLQVLERGGGRVPTGPGESSPAKRAYVAKAGLDPMSLDARGARCDRCGKEASPETKLKSCSKCVKAYYCSSGCQKEDWKEGGHREWCRPKGECRVGDTCMLMNLKSKPELNGTVVTVESAPAEEGGRWTVQGPGGVPLAVKAANLNVLLVK